MTSLKLPELKAKLAQIKSTTPNVVDLSNDGLGNDSVVNCLALWLDTHRPRDIILRNCDITDKTMHMIACFCRSNDNLKLLCLRDNQIGEKGCSILSELCFTNKYIESIDLFGNPLLDSPSSSMADINALIDLFEGSNHLKSLCGCTPQAPELTLFKPLNDEYESTFITADLKKSTFMKSLQLIGSSGFSQIVDAVQINSTLLRLKVTDFQLSRVGVAALKSTLAANSTLKTLQLSFKPEEDLGNANIDLYCAVFESVGCNSSISTVQIDSMPFNLEVIGAIGKMVQQNHSIVNLSLFNMPFKPDQLRSLLYSFEGNSTIRLLHLSEGCEVSSELHSTIESVAEARMYPLTLRVGESDFKYGQDNSKSTNDDFEVEDVVEAFHDGDGWCPASVLVVQKDYKYCVKFHSGQIKVNYRGQLLRRGDHFYRHHCIPVPINTDTRSVASVEEPSQQQQQQPESNSTAIAVSDISIAPAVVVNEQYPYRVGQEVEVRFMGDLLWYTGRVTKATLPSLVDVAILEGESGREGMTDEQVFQHDLQLVQMEYPLWLVRDVFPHRDSEGSYYDVGFYQRGDYVEVYRKHFGGWRRGRLAVDRKNGTYDVRFEDHEEQRVRGRYLRHHFKANSVADCRLIGTIEWSRNVTVVGQDKNSGMYVVKYSEGPLSGKEERTVHPRRLMPCERSQFRVWAEQYHAETNTPVRVSGGRVAGVQLLAEASNSSASAAAPVQYEPDVSPIAASTTTAAAAAPSALKVETAVLSLTSSSEDIVSSPVAEYSSPLHSQPYAADIAAVEKEEEEKQEEVKKGYTQNENKSTPEVTLAFQETKKAAPTVAAAAPIVAPVKEAPPAVIPAPLIPAVVPSYFPMEVASSSGSAFASEANSRRASKANVSAANSTTIRSSTDERRPSNRPTPSTGVAVMSSSVSAGGGDRRQSVKNGGFSVAPTIPFAVSSAAAAAGGAGGNGTEDRRPSTKPSLSSEEVRRGSVRPAAPASSGVSSVDESRRTSLRPTVTEEPSAAASFAVDYYKGVQLGERVEVFEPISRRYTLRTIQQVNPDGTFDVVDEYGDVTFGLDDSQLKPKIGGSGKSNNAFVVTAVTATPALFSQSMPAGQLNQYVGSNPTAAVAATDKAPVKYKVGARIEALVSRHDDSAEEEEGDEPQWLSGVVAQFKGNSNEYVVVLDEEERDRLVPASRIRPANKVVENSVDYADDLSAMRAMLASAIKPPQQQLPTAPTTGPSTHTQASPIRNRVAQPSQTQDVTKTPMVSNVSTTSTTTAGDILIGGAVARTPVTYSSSTAQAIMSASSHHTTATVGGTNSNDISVLTAASGGGGGKLLRTPVTVSHLHYQTKNSPPTASGGAAPALPALQPKPTTSSDNAVSEIEAKLGSQLGIKDTEKCASVAQCLVQQGCSSWSEMLDLGGLFDTGDEKVDIEGLRKFLQEAGVPLFIAAKLAAYIKKS